MKMDKKKKIKTSKQVKWLKPEVKKLDIGYISGLSVTCYIGSDLGC